MCKSLILLRFLLDIANKALPIRSFSMVLSHKTRGFVGLIGTIVRFMISSQKKRWKNPAQKNFFSEEMNACAYVCAYICVYT